MDELETCEECVPTDEEYTSEIEAAFAAAVEAARADEDTDDSEVE